MTPADAEKLVEAYGRLEFDFGVMEEGGTTPAQRDATFDALHKARAALLAALTEGKKYMGVVENISHGPVDWGEGNARIHLYYDSDEVASPFPLGCRVWVRVVKVNP